MAKPKLPKSVRNHDAALTMEVPEAPAPSAEKVAIVVNLARQQYRLEREAAELNRALEAKLAELRHVQESALPAALSVAGLDALPLDKGFVVRRETVYSAKALKETSPGGFAWLVDHNADDLIKHEFTVQFGKGEEKLAAALKKYLMGRKYAAARMSEERSVHQSTLKAYVKEQVEAGVAVPLDLLGAHVFTRAVIVPPAAAPGSLD